MMCIDVKWRYSFFLKTIVFLRIIEERGRKDLAFGCLDRLVISARGLINA